MTSTPSSRTRRTALGIAALALAGQLLATPSASAQGAYPSKPVRIVVPVGAGTGPDMVARILAQKLTEAWGGHAVVVDNRPGAGGLIAAQEIQKATPDGHHLLLAETGIMSIATSSYSKLPYDPVKDFIPVSHVVYADFALLVNPQKVSATNVKDFIDYARRQSPLFMATFGPGTPGHFGAYFIGEAQKIKVEPVHFRTTPDALGAMFSGDTQAVFASIGLAAPQVKGGKLAALATSGGARSPALPQVPTFKELGYQGMEFASWFGIVAPAGTPADIVNKLNADLVKIVTAPDNRQKLEEAGFRVTGTSRQDFARIIAEDTVTWGKAVRATGFKAD
ncbi:MAG: tripartite tricarboxylate transporter substrate binding protein [Rhodoferax sp.]